MLPVRFGFCSIAKYSQQAKRQYTTDWSYLGCRKACTVQNGTEDTPSSTETRLVVSAIRKHALLLKSLTEPVPKGARGHVVRLLAAIPNRRGFRNLLDPSLPGS